MAILFQHPCGWELNGNQKAVGINWQDPTQGTAYWGGSDLGLALWLPGCLKGTPQSQGGSSECKSICCQHSSPFPGAIWKQKNDRSRVTPHTLKKGTKSAIFQNCDCPKIHILYFWVFLTRVLCTFTDGFLFIFQMEDWEGRITVENLR